MKFILLPFSAFSKIFRRDIDRKLPSSLDAAVLGIGIIWLNLKSSGKHSLRHLGGGCSTYEHSGIIKHTRNIAT